MLYSFDFDRRAAAVDSVHAQTSLYTSLSVVDELLTDLDWPNRPGRLLDTSCGDGAFLTRALERLPLAVDDLSSLQRVRGWEFHPGAAADARENVEALLVRHGWSVAVARQGAHEVVTEADFLTDGPPEGEFGIICGNPPYLRWAYTPDILRELYASRVPKHARADLLHAFLDRCSRLLPADGIMGFVAADRFLFNETAAVLRARLGDRLAVQHVSRLDPATSFTRPKRRVKGTPPRVHPVKIIFVPAGHGRGMPLTEAPVCPDDFGQQQADAGPTVPLNDIAIVRLAPWMGPEGIFVVTHDVAAKLVGADLVPAVDTDDVDPNKDVLGAPYRVALRTVKDTEPAPSVCAHLQREMHRMPERGRKATYWCPPEPITLPLDRPALLIPRIARRLRVVDLPAGIVPINHNLTVVNATEGVDLATLRTALTSSFCQQWITRNAPRLENGFLSITTTLLKRMPIRVSDLKRTVIANAA